MRGDFSAGDRQFFWDVNYATGQNKASQTVNGTYNIAHIQRALGPVASCTAPCVPLNFFGGPGSITPDMLQYILFTENDRSKQDLDVLTANISGDIVQLPGGMLAFAGGYEHRKLSGSYTPDSIVTSGESNGVPSGPTNGSYSVNEYYLELNAPLPCNGATGAAGTRCSTLGVPNPATFEQANSQISVVTGGNTLLKPETSTSLTVGALYSPSWAENTSWSQKLDFELTWYRIRIQSAIQASNRVWLASKSTTAAFPSGKRRRV